MGKLKVQRYKFLNNDFFGLRRVDEDDNGNFVHFVDYQKVEQQRDRLLEGLRQVDRTQINGGNRAVTIVQIDSICKKLITECEDSHE